MANQETHTLIPAREALKILTWVTYHGLYRGSRGTGELTKFPHGCYSKEECEALRDSMVAKGNARSEKQQFDRRRVPAELV